VQWAGRQQAAFLSPDPAEEVRRIFPALQSPITTSNLTPHELRDLIKAEFRADYAEGLKDRMDAGIDALREVHTQLSMAECSSEAVTEVQDGAVRVRVEAVSGSRGRTSAGAFVFQYRIRVSNEGGKPVQLIGREWRFRNLDGSVHASVPKGSAGVVGHTPVIAPGQSFEYSSGTTLSSPEGRAEGSFQMVVLEDNTEFDAAVGAFRCVHHE